MKISDMYFKLDNYYLENIELNYYFNKIKKKIQGSPHKSY